MELRKRKDVALLGSLGGPNTRVHAVFCIAEPQQLPPTTGTSNTYILQTTPGHHALALCSPPSAPMSQEEADLYVEPIEFKPRQLASLANHKRLEKLNNLGAVDGLLRGRGLGTYPCLVSRRGLPARLCKGAHVISGPSMPLP